MNTKRVNAAADVIARAMANGRRVPSAIAVALESTQMLMSPELAAESEQLRSEVADLRAERHTTNEALADTTIAQRAAEARGDLGTLPAWLYQRFIPGGLTWEYLDDGTRAYWEHQARAVQRAVARGGFKDPTPPAADDVTPQVEKLRNLLAGQREPRDGEHYASVHHAYKIPHDLPPLGGVS